MLLPRSESRLRLSIAKASFASAFGLHCLTASDEFSKVVDCPENRFYLLAAKARIIPSTTPKNAANNTWYSPGNMKVTVCAGTQKKGMVFLNTKFHCTRQFIPAMISPTLIGVQKALKPPPHCMICVSVILCKVMNTGAKAVFCKSEIKKAPRNLFQLRGWLMAPAIAPSALKI